MKLILSFILLLLPCYKTTAEEAAFRQTHGKNAPDYYDPENLTDHEKWTSENYIHEGLLQRKFLEECKANKETEAACQGQAANKKFMGMSPAMVQALARMYSTVIGVAGGDLVSVDQYDEAHAEENSETAISDDKKSLDDQTKETSKKSEKEDKGASDYCKYIATGTEAVALAQQTLAQQAISETPSTEETAQKDALFKASRTHDERSKQAKTQTIGWGSTTACYSAMMAIPAMNVSAKAWQNWAKLAAAAGLTAFFKTQIDAHAEYRDKVLAIAEKLPGKGDCNPVTQKDCYCAQEETKYDPKVCLPYLHKQELAKNTLRVTCIDDKLNADPKCTCITTDSCYDKEYMNMINGLNFGKAELGAAATPFGSLARGKLSGAKLGTETAKMFAKAKDSLRKIDSKLASLKTEPLSASQQKEAEALETLGLPKNLANKLASQPLTPQLKSAMGNFNNNTNRQYSNNSHGIGNSGKVLNFSGGDGLRPHNAKSNDKIDFLSKFGLKKKKPITNGKIIHFLSKAEEAAQINHNTNRLLFDIITHRYQTSAWRRLEIEK